MISERNPRDETDAPVADIGGHATRPTTDGPLTPEEEEDFLRLQQNPAWPHFVEYLRKTIEENPQPVISESAGRALGALLHKNQGRFGAVSDTPTTCTEAAAMAGLKGRGPVDELLKKGLVHSYGRRHGLVPTVYLHEEKGRKHWHSLTRNQQKILRLFIGKPWKHRLDGTQIAEKLGRTCKGQVGVVGDENIRKEIKGLVRINALKAFPPRGGYSPDPRGWPTDSPGSPFCPLLDHLALLESRRQAEQYRQWFFARHGPFPLPADRRT